MRNNAETWTVPPPLSVSFVRFQRNNLHALQPDAVVDGSTFTQSNNRRDVPFSVEQGTLSEDSKKELARLSERQRPVTQTNLRE
jgi:hypothetical protein